MREVESGIGEYPSISPIGLVRDRAGEVKAMIIRVATASAGYSDAVGGLTLSDLGRTHSGRIVRFGCDPREKRDIDYRELRKRKDADVALEA